MDESTPQTNLWHVLKDASLFCTEKTNQFRLRFPDARPSCGTPPLSDGEEIDAKVCDWVGCMKMLCKEDEVINSDCLERIGRYIETSKAGSRSRTGLYANNIALAAILDFLKWHIEVSTSSEIGTNSVV